MMNEKLKINLLNISSEYTGSTSFFLNCLKYVIETDRKFLISLTNSQLKEEVTDAFLGFINKIDSFDAESFGYNSEYCICHYESPVFLKNAFSDLKVKTNEFMSSSKYRVYIDCCKINNYEAPYLFEDANHFLNDSLRFSINEVLDIIRLENDDYFAYKIRDNESPFPEDLQKSNNGNLNIFITLSGLINFNIISELKSKNELLGYIKKLLAKNFYIIPKEFINRADFLNFEGNKQNTSLIVGNEIKTFELYNEYLDGYHDVVIKGFIWYNDDVNGITYDYLKFNDQKDYIGEFSHSIPFENVIFKYLITYLELERLDRNNIEDLNYEGFWQSREHYSNQ